ncbi:flagellar hook-length control protein FliK [Sphingomonas sp. 4RDLI-65]|uniref:flagellar hook-length control protein FliK n=1 Tax=Sphingomonas sp. 4RDLI-65 TaxID=3111641 RepID=UPI003C1993CB
MSNSPSSGGSEPVLANPAQTDATYPAMILSDMPLATVDGLKPMPVRNGGAKEAAPTTYIAPDAPTGDGVPTRSPPAATLASASSEPLPPIAGKPETAFASPTLATASAGTLAHEPQDPSLFPVVAPAVTAPATDVVRVPGITVPTASVPAKNAAPLGTDAARRTANRATVSVADALLPPRAAIAPSIPTTTIQGASVAGSQGLPIVTTNPLVPLAAKGVSAATPVESSASPSLVASTPPLTGTLRWTATEATTPVALAVAQPDSFQPQAGTVASAAQVFGAAIQAATKARDTETTGSIDAASVSAALAPAPQVVAAAAQQAPLDMRQERWPHAMIEHIEMIRDAADATDTRIRLIPDALGAIDVSVKTDGDTVHVHFNAEQAATRTLLADAQPRLAELAEARGLKLGQGALGDGNTGSSQQRAPTPSQIPNRTATATAVIADAAEDTRIA